METEKTDKNVLNQGLKFMAISLLMMFIGPTIIYNAFINKENNWHWIVLGVGILVCFFAVYFAFKGLNTIMNSMFKK